MTMLQRELYQKLRAESVAAHQTLVDVLRPFAPAKLHEHPEPTGWSVAQVAEHLCVSHETTAAAATSVARLARPDAGAPAREWKPSLLGNMIANSLQNPRKLKSPKVFQPGPSPRNGVIEALIGSELEFITLLDSAESLDWRALKVASPALWSWAPRMNLGDVFKIHVVHVARHTKQIERVIALL
ncbi:MAG: DinB family protein [bacterium]